LSFTEIDETTKVRKKINSGKCLMLTFFPAFALLRSGGLLAENRVKMNDGLLLKQDKNFV